MSSTKRRHLSSSGGVEMTDAIVQSKLRPMRTCQDCGESARYEGTWWGRCPDCTYKWQMALAEEEGRVSQGNRP